MKKIGKQILKSIMYFSRQEREERSFGKYTQERIRLEGLTLNRLRHQHVTLKSKYEYKKNIYVVFIGAILLSILTGSWKFLFELAKKIIQYVSLQENTEASLVTGWTTILIIFYITLTLLIFIALLGFIRTLYHLNRELLMIEDELERRQIDRK